MGAFTLQAQEHSLRYSIGNKEYHKRFSNKKLMLVFLEKELKNYQVNGYLEAHYDTVLLDSTSYKASLVKGDLFKTGKITIAGDVQQISAKENKLFTPNTLKNVAERRLSYLECNGFPFANFMLDSVAVTNNRVNASLVLDKGPYYKIDSLIVKGGAKISDVYLQRYVGIKPGMAYNEKSIVELDKRLKEIPFLAIIKPSEVLFTQNQSMVYVYVKKRNASSFNGIVGVLPDAKTGKTTITGDARIILKNALGKAETFDLNWRKVANKTQDLKINLTVPFLFKSPIGTDMVFKLFKRDTSFLENTKQAAITWQMSRGNFFKIFYSGYNSNVLAKTIYVSSANSLQNADVGINQYGMGIRFEKLDYRLNPRKGIVLSSDVAAGSKQLKPSAVNDESIYVNEKLKTEYYNAVVTAENFLPFGKLFTLKTGLNGRMIINEKLYKNELLRLGGIKSLRGFDEESILANAYAVGTIEWRFLFEENSAIFAFFDQCWYENNAVGGYKKDNPFGFGAGVNFQVKTGVFSFTWALGKQQGNDILFRNSKLHFGFINYF